MSLQTAIGPGRLIAVVGPSGAGKDSVMRAAMSALAGERVTFPRRVITRPADDHEDHLPVTLAQFREMEEADTFAFAWTAHGLNYGISRQIDDLIREGRAVVVNVSRGIVPLLRERYLNRTVASITVDPRCLERRLLKRRRETPHEIVLRLERAGQEALTGPDVVEIENNGPLEVAVERFIALVRSIEQAT